MFYANTHIHGKRISPVCQCAIFYKFWEIIKNYGLRFALIIIKTLYRYVVIYRNTEFIEYVLVNAYTKFEVRSVFFEGKKPRRMAASIAIFLLQKTSVENVLEPENPWR
jgi:hypothetical protein